MNIPKRKRQIIFWAVFFGLFNAAVIPQLSDTASLVYGAVCLFGCCFLYAGVRRFRRDTVAQHS